MSTTLVYRYGLATPAEGHDTVFAQIRAAHEYRCALTRIERGRRAAVRALYNDLAPDIVEAEARVRAAEDVCERLGSGIKSARKKARKRAESTEQRAELQQARAASRAAKKELYARRQHWAPQCPDCRKAKSEEVPCPHATIDAKRLRERIDEIDERVGEITRNARAHAGLYWGTYLLVERAHRASASAPLYKEDGITPHDPPFPIWNGSGAVAVQIQSTRPMPVKKLLSHNDSTALAKITPPVWAEEFLAQNPIASDAGGPAERHAGYRPDGTPAPAFRSDGSPARWLRDRAARHGMLRMRVGKDEGHAEWRLDYHRPLPQDGNVTWIVVRRTVRGPHSEWSVEVTVDTPARAETSPTTDSAVAVDIGWRQLPDGSIRVAGWRDTKGNRGQLMLTPTDVRALREASRVAAERDGLFERTRARLKQWITSTPNTPSWMHEEAQRMHAWRRQGRLVWLFRRWTTDRTERPDLSGEEAIYGIIEAWVSTDRHLWAAQESRRIWGLRRRNDKYRVWAAQLVRQYGTIVLEQFDLRKMSERKPVDQDSAENKIARSNRQLVAVSIFRQRLVERAKLEPSKTVAAMPAYDTTRQCPSCGDIDDRPAAESIELRCRACGHHWDQDVDGAPQVLLTRWCERSGDAKILAGARSTSNTSEQETKKSDRWERARRMSAAKKARRAERS
jgi:hypothetical protein